MGITINTISLDHIVKIGIVSLGILAESIMFSSLSFIIFKTSANIVANICIPLLLPLLLTIVDVLAKSKIKVADFWIENTILLATDNSKFVFILLVSLCYIFIFTILGVVLTKRKEIK